MDTLWRANYNPPLGIEMRVQERRTSCSRGDSARMVFSVLGVLAPKAHWVLRLAGQARIESQLMLRNAIAR